LAAGSAEPCASARNCCRRHEALDVLNSGWCLSSFPNIDFTSGSVIPSTKRSNVSCPVAWQTSRADSSWLTLPRSGNSGPTPRVSSLRLSLDRVSRRRRTRPRYLRRLRGVSRLLTRAPGARRRHPADRPRHEDKREVERLLPGGWWRAGVGGQFFAGSDIVDQRRRGREDIYRVLGTHAMHRSDQQSCPRSDRRTQTLTARSWGGVQVPAKQS
jgi:hypothetical protein